MSLVFSSYKLLLAAASRADAHTKKRGTDIKPTRSEIDTSKRATCNRAALFFSPLYIGKKAVRKTILHKRLPPDDDATSRDYYSIVPGKNTLRWPAP